METLQKIKEDYAKDNLFNDWEDFENHGISDSDLNEIAQRYWQEGINEVLDKAAELAKPFSEMIDEDEYSDIKMLIDKEELSKLKNNEGI